MAATRIISIIGRKNAGKTTLTVALASELVRRGLRVMTMKHADHPAQVDQPGVDSWRHFHEGRAERVLLVSPDMRALFKNGRFGAKVLFLFDHLGIIEAAHATAGLDIEGAAIEAGAQDVEPLEAAADEGTGARFFTEPTDLDSVTSALRSAGWSVTTSEMGYRPKEKAQLWINHDKAQRDTLKMAPAFYE